MLRAFGVVLSLPLTELIVSVDDVVMFFLQRFLVKDQGLYFDKLRRPGGTRAVHTKAFAFYTESAYCYGWLCKSVSDVRESRPARRTTA
jgi:hypothetical protein